MNILSDKEKVLLLGNEAVARGALEAGVDFVSTYPGTPASEIGNSFFKVRESDSEIRTSFYFEYSANEKVALEAGIGASFSGLKTLVAMKHFGLNVAQEALLPFTYTGTVGPTVVAVSDDPSCHSSAQSEQNTRFQARLAHIPTLEPADPQEARDFTKLGFRLSGEYEIPVLVRLTTRVSHQRAGVEVSGIKPKKRKKGDFEKRPEKFVTMPPRVLEMKEELLEKGEEIREFVEESDLNPVSGKGKKKGVVSSGVSHLYLREALSEEEVSVLKVGFFQPLPEEKMSRFLENKEEVLVVEELEPCLERAVSRLAKESNPDLKVRGKDLLPRTGEFTPDLVEEALFRFLGREKKRGTGEEVEVPSRSPRPCPGCPYWSTFGAVKEAVEEKEVVFGGDIGCYMLAGIPRLGLQDYLSSMGSSLGIAHGIKKANSDQPLIAFIGDSTFFHAGLPALANMVYNRSNALVIIMDNWVTAMTGQQPNPGERIDLEKAVRGLGVEKVAVVDPTEEREKLVKKVEDFIGEEEVSVIIARSPCLFAK